MNVSGGFTSFLCTFSQNSFSNQMLLSAVGCTLQNVGRLLGNSNGMDAAGVFDSLMTGS